MLSALDALEKLSDDYSYEMKYLSKRIRLDIWNNGVNSKQLAFVIDKINCVFSVLSSVTGRKFFSLDTVIEYVRCLAKYQILYSKSLDTNYFNDLINDIQLKSAEKIIEKQWQDVNASDDGYKCFLSIFDDVFSHAINLHKDRFFHRLNDTDVLCRVVDGWGHTTERFIPWPSKTNNRWNPPGKQFLYLSFGNEEIPYSSDLSINEYICLEEYRAEKGKQYSFCHFKPTTEGNILDLSYNDISMGSIKLILDNHYNETVQNIVGEMLSEPNAKLKYKNERKLRNAIIQKMNEHPVNEQIVEESVAKQYLKMVCSCIYQKVDETDESKRELAYKSFHILSEYLESKGVTGIIYPCTRTKKINGKNIVLFNVKDAIPIEDSIREYLYK